jgi:hypothetical protein
MVRHLAEFRKARQPGDPATQGFASEAPARHIENPEQVRQTGPPPMWRTVNARTCGPRAYAPNES